GRGVSSAAAGGATRTTPASRSADRLARTLRCPITRRDYDGNGRSWPQPWRVRAISVRFARFGVRVRGSAGEGFVGGVVDPEDLGEAGDPEDLQQPFLGADQLERTVVDADLLEATDQHAQTGGVEE